MAISIAITMVVCMPIRVTVCVPIRMTIGMSVRLLTSQLGKVMVRLAKHPYRERHLEVRISDRNGFVEHAFECFLVPRAVL